MLPDRVSHPGPMTYESGALPIALRGPALLKERICKFLLLGVDPNSDGRHNKNSGVTSLERVSIHLKRAVQAHALCFLET